MSRGEFAVDQYKSKRFRVPAAYVGIYDVLASEASRYKPHWSELANRPTFSQLRYIARLCFERGMDADDLLIVDPSFGLRKFDKWAATDIIEALLRMEETMGKMKEVSMQQELNPVYSAREYEALKAEKAFADEQLRSERTQNNENKRSLNALKTQIAELESRCSNLQRLLDGANSRAESFAKELDTARLQQRNLQETCEAYMADASEYREQRDKAVAAVQAGAPFVRRYFGTHFGVDFRRVKVTYSKSDGTFLHVEGPTHKVGVLLEPEDTKEIARAIYCAALQQEQDHGELDE